MSYAPQPLSCQESRGLIGAYVDGELSQAQASLLRQHLLDCVTCRTSTQDLKALRRWFAPKSAASDALVPSGFAARVTRRAFAGDTGERAAPLETPAVSPAGVGAAGQARLRAFVIGLTGLAAAAAVVAALAIQAQQRPTERDLRAEDQALPSNSELIDRLDALNRENELEADGTRR